MFVISRTSPPTRERFPEEPLHSCHPRFARTGGGRAARRGLGNVGKVVGFGSTASRLDGIWSAAPDQHNGSVPSLAGVLDSRLPPLLAPCGGSGV
ncbi:hypothetical protein [uncultured Paracoccus sp.]|uniref:c-type cytochrome n=1 Tax=uncultured Paracoccus sp. TaxID=189685 RepID=UPI003459501D